MMTLMPTIRQSEDYYPAGWSEAASAVALPAIDRCEGNAYIRGKANAPNRGQEMTARWVTTLRARHDREWLRWPRHTGSKCGGVIRLNWVTSYMMERQRRSL
jgi:hypothetical protein